LLADTAIFIPFKKEAPHQRHRMTMDIIDFDFQKDLVTFKQLANDMLRAWQKERFYDNYRFPESEFRLKFGSHAPHASWHHVSEFMKFQVCEFSPNQELPNKLEPYVEFLSFWSKKSGWFQYPGGRPEFHPADDNSSWVKPMHPKEEFLGTKIYYNAEVGSNTPNWFNFQKPLELNPQTGVISNNVPLYVLDVEHNLKIDDVACIHVRMTSFANDNKYHMINTELDATNRIDQDIAAPFLFTIDEFVDCANQKAPFPITTHATAFAGNQAGPDGNDFGELKGHYVDILGQKLELQELLDDMTLLTDCSLSNCKNNRNAVFNNVEERWKEGRLFSEWTGDIVPSDDEEAYNEFCKAEMARLNAPVLLAKMIQTVRKYKKRKIAMVFHITGYPESVRFFKNRLHHLNPVPEYCLRHPRFEALFEGNYFIKRKYSKSIIFT